jgi:glycosyltransferase involved in cell wall biosynthesis
MKVLMFGTLPLDLKSVRGGVESAIINLLSGFRKLENLEVVHISFSKDATEEFESVLTPNVRVLFIPFKSRFPILDYWLNRKKLSQLIKNEAPQIIHIQESEPHLLRFLCYPRKNIVVTQHGIMREELKYASGLVQVSKFIFKSTIERFLFPTFNNIIFISEYNRNLFKGRLLNGYQIYNAVNPDFFKQNADFSADRNSLIYVGVISRRKNLRMVIEALHLLKKQQVFYTLQVVGGYKDGDRSYKEEIDELVRTYGLANQITFHGWLKQNEIPDLISRSAYFILPSNQETLPVSIAEAMAMGKVIIATDVGAVREMFEDKASGYLIKKDDVKGLVNLLTALDQNKRLSEFSMNATKEAYEKYYPDSNALKTFEFYKQVYKGLSQES